MERSGYFLPGEIFRQPLTAGSPRPNRQDK